MSSRAWRLRVQDIITAIDSIRRYTEHLAFEEFQDNEIVVQAVLYNFIVMGEAVRNIPDEIQSLYPQIPWRQIGGTRNVAAHEYFQIKLTIIWNAICNNLPTLRMQLQDLLSSELDDRDRTV